MKRFPFLRKPVRLILYTALMTLLTTEALVFAWQYKLDGILLDHAIDTYAYLGTVVRTDGQILDSTADRDLSGAESDPQLGGPAYVEIIPEGLVQWLEEDPHVARVDNRVTQAAVLGECYRVNSDSSGQMAKVPDRAMSAAGTNYFFLEGTVSQGREYMGDEGDPVASDNFSISVTRMWNDPQYTHANVQLSFDRLGTEAPLQIGQKIFLVAKPTYTADGTPSETSCYLMTLGYMEYFGYDPEINLEHHYTLIPDGVNAEEYIREFLAETGLDAVLERQNRGQHAVTVHRSADMNMIPKFAEGKALCYEGRVLTPEDAGEKVCVISAMLAQRNRLSVGDTVQLSLAEGSYTLNYGSDYDGWQTGEPGEGDELLSYGEYEEYEIVGIYSQKGRRTENALYYPLNDIFLPAQEGLSQTEPRPYSYSFRIPGPEYLEFLADAEPVLQEYGYSLMVEDTGWDDVKESFYSMLTRRQLTLLCAGAAFAAAVLVLAVLLNAHCKYEYGLRRLMGATKGEAVGIYAGVFAFTALPGALVSVAAGWYAAMTMATRAAMEDGSTLPDTLASMRILSGWAAAELAGIAAVLMVLALWNERRGLLRLIRR